jgi:hypothetical protein
MDIGRDPGRGPNIIQWKWHGRDNQQWLYDPATGKVRSKLDNLVLDILGPPQQGAQLVAARDSASQTQQWMLLNVSNPKQEGPVREFFTGAV